MGTVQNLMGDSANVARGTDPGSSHLLANTGSQNPINSLNNATAVANGTTVDFGSAKKTVSFQVVPAGSISAGAVGFQVSADGLTWITPAAAGATAPSVGLVSLTATAATNPFTIATGGQQLFFNNVPIAVRYARANVTTTVTGTGAGVTVQISAC